MTREASREARPPENLLRLLDNSGATLSGGRRIQHGTQYKVSLGPDTVNLNLYHTGKSLVQGKPSPLKRLLDYWRASEPGVGKTASRSAAGGAVKSIVVKDATPRVGTDEAGKGDYFGPLVVAGVRVLGEEASCGLRSLGVRDSKLLTDDVAVKISDGIVGLVGEGNVCVVVVGPPEYESRRWAAGDVNKLLAEVNVHILNELADEVELFVVDQFAKAARSRMEPHLPSGVRLEVRPRAESDEVAVAAASILARARYLEELRKLSKEAGFVLPKGATHVVPVAKRVYRERGMEGLKKLAKVHFQTTKRVVGEDR